MKAKCRQAARYGWTTLFTVGKTYNVEKMGKRYVLLGGYISFSKEAFEEHFEEVKE